MWALLLSIAFLTILARLKSRRNSALPPGPPGLPFLGNVLEIRSAPVLWLKLEEYAKIYGGIFTIRFLGRPIIVISDPGVITELFEKRPSGFATRPSSSMADLIGWTETIVFVPYGPRLRTYRKLLHQVLNPRATLDFQDLHTQETRKLMKRLAQEPEGFLTHTRLYGGSVSIRITYGYTVRNLEDEFIKEAEQMIKVFNEALLPGRWLVETLPLLRFVPSWFPGATFKRKAKEWAGLTNRYWQAPFDYVVKHLAEGTAEPSFTSKLLDPEDGRVISAPERDMIKVLASGLYGAGTDTTVNLLQSFFLAMTLHPHVQTKAQAEIDAHLANSSPNASDPDPSTRILTVADREHLPYTHAVVSEIIRWHPVGNLVQRCTQEDENIGNYVIPKGTIIIGNLWSMLHKSDVYTNPEKFWPERFLGDKPPPDPATYAFGFGRRICPGIHIAQQSLWITISNILANFTINKACTVDGQQITPQEAYTADILSRPLPFECSIKPRSTESQSFIDETDL